MISLDCSHPDLEEFLEIKSDLNRVTKANISVKITDDFMKAVKNNDDFKLEFKREETGEVISKIVKAKDIFNKLATMNWDFAEPGCLYWDTINNWNLLTNTKEFSYAGTNPCAEEPLPAGGSCLLGSINLSEFVLNPFTANAQFNIDGFIDCVKKSTIALNEVLDEGLPLHPLQEQRESVANWRQIGLGIFGLADMLIKLGIKYGSEESIKLCDQIGFHMINSSIQQSALLAKDFGCFPKCNKDEILNTEFFIQNTNSKTTELVSKYGLRNSQLLTIAPTGTLSTMLGVSGGIEPIFANYYERKTESLHGKDTYYKVYTKIVDEYMKKHNIKDDKDLPEFFTTAQTLDYKDRIDMQSIWQHHIDASISSTVNVPNNFTVEDTESLYMYAWEKKLKGITIFRDGCKRLGILTTDNSNTSDATETNYNTIQPISRKTIGTTHGNTYCKKCACGTLYITINRDDNDNIVECFVHTSKGGICQANIGAVNRMTSLAMRSGVKIEEIIDQLKGIDCKACLKGKTKGENIDGLSCPDIMAKTLMEFCNDQPKELKHNNKKLEKPDDKCPDCGSRINHEGGCVICTECGWSKCN